jgi:hypothetical protein
LATKHNLKDLVHQNKEKDDRIRELEEPLRHTKKDKGSLKEFNKCTEKVKTKLNEMDIDMYAHFKSSSSWKCK